MHIIDLTGSWSCEYGEFVLPGSANDNKIGKEQQHYSTFTKEAVRAPRQKYEYTGELFIEREIELEKDYTDMYAELFMERVNMCSALWIDGKKVGRDKIELSAPHRYDISEYMTQGRHTLRIKLDNSNLLNIHEMASGYSVDTQDYWLGIIGKFEIRIMNRLHISYMKIFTEGNAVRASICVNSHCKGCDEKCGFKIRLTVTTPTGETLETREYDCTVRNRREILDLTYIIDGEIKTWDEFSPELYSLRAELIYNDTSEEYTDTFGFRKIEVQGRHMLINGKRISLRGTTDCAIFPLTGYPPTDTEYWIKHFGIMKEYGLNYVRCHAWCPPDAAFKAADKLGIYLSIEMPLWLNYDVCPLDTGADDIHKYYFTNEALEISKTYGNHPSFIMFSNGNELLGDHEMLEYITTQIKAVDNRRLYTMTSNFIHSIRPCEDYFCTFEAADKRIRLQIFYNETAESTCLTYDDAIDETPIPVVSFEIGQYCMYPDTDVIEKYTGNMLPVNFETIKNEMMCKGVYGKLTSGAKIYTNISDIDFTRNEKAVVLATEESLKNPLKGDFRATFWSPVFFDTDRTSSLWCDASHHVFDKFPTDEFVDFQWKEPMDGSVSVELSKLPDGFDVLLEPIPNFCTNIQRTPLFEAKVGNMDILFCGFDFSADDPANTALKNSICEYVLSPDFSPEQKLDPEQFTNIFKEA